jgi:predicted Zn-dependent peptidase
LNQPYGDVWLQLRPLAYHVHPYKWATIGKEISHIEDATMEDVKSFFKEHYNPSNAIVCVAGNFELEEIKALMEKWYGDIPAGKKPVRMLNTEPKQEEFREKLIERDVPANAFYYAFKMPERRDPEYYIADILSDALGRDKSSRLYTSLKKEMKLVSEIGAYITGSMDNGLLIISGKLNDGVTFNMLDHALWNELEKLRSEQIDQKEMDRLMIKIRTSKEFQEQGLLNRAMNLCLFELLGDANGVNEEHEIYLKIQPEHLLKMAKKILKPENCSLLKVKASKNA